MSQEEVIDLLERIKKPLSRGEIASKLNQDLSQVSHALMRLVKFHEVKIIEINSEQSLELYHCKRRMRLYYTGK